MSSQNKNMRNVVIVLVVLLAIWGIIKLKENKQGDRSFKALVIQVDTAEVNHIEIQLSKQKETLNLVKDANTWKVNLAKSMVQANNGMVSDLLSQLMNLKPKHIAANDKANWANYEVDDSLGTRIKLMAGKKELADLVLGKFSYTQPQGANPYQQRNVIMTSYVRPYDEKTVYAVDGYLSMMFNREKNAFRESAIISGKTKDWNRLVFSYPSDSSFTLINQNGKWLIDGIRIDSASVANYLSAISRLSGNSFDDANALEQNQPALYRVTIEGDNHKPIEVKALKNSLGEEVYISSINKGNVFNDSLIKSTLFVNKQYFMAKPTNN
jgi:outer membrane murein-binding lipoprotein Lpp